MKRRSRASRVVCYQHLEVELPCHLHGLHGACDGCREQRRAYTCTPAYQRRERMKRMSAAVLRCGFSFAEFAAAMKAANRPMRRLKKALRQAKPRRITVREHRT